jgi:hypothetical protein
VGKMPKFSEGTAALAALAAFALWIFVVLPLLYYPRYEAPNNEKRAAHSENKAESISPPLVPYHLFTSAGRDQIAAYCATDSSHEKQDWTHKYICDVRITDAYVALFTGTLTFVTVGLIGVGYFTLRQMRVTEKRELRAYVGIILSPESVIQIIPNQRPRAGIMIKNFGQTPGYDVVVNTNIAPDAFPLNGNTLPDLDRTETGSRMVIHPGEELHSDGISQEPINQAEFVRLQMEQETRRVYFYGEITYSDVFRKQHTTRFRLHTPSGAPGGHQRFQYSYDGNDAD